MTLFQTIYSKWDAYPSSRGPISQTYGAYVTMILATKIISHPQVGGLREDLQETPIFGLFWIDSPGLGSSSHSEEVLRPLGPGDSRPTEFGGI